MEWENWLAVASTTREGGFRNNFGRFLVRGAIEVGRN